MPGISSLTVQGKCEMDVFLTEFFFNTDDSLKRVNAAFNVSVISLKQILNSLFKYAKFLNFCYSKDKLDFFLLEIYIYYKY